MRRRFGVREHEWKSASENFEVVQTREALATTFPLVFVNFLPQVLFVKEADSDGWATGLKNTKAPRYNLFR